MRDLTKDFLKANNYKEYWTKETIKEFVELWRKEDNLLIFDCDIEVGEQWISIVRDNKKIGILGLCIPILFIIEMYTISNMEFELFKNVIEVQVQDINSKVFCIDVNKLNNVIPELSWHTSNDIVNQECMSINDLWYATL